MNYNKLSLAVAFVVAGPAAAQDTFGTANIDWSGTYISGTIGRANYGVKTDIAGPTLTLSENDLGYSISLGHQVQTGRVVVGGELSIWDVAGEIEVAGVGSAEIDRGLSAAVKLGYEMGKSLIYGTAGYSNVKFSLSGLGSETEDGYNFGLGIDFKATDRVTYGVNYTSHNFSLESGGGPNVSVFSDVVGFRMSYSF